MKTKRIDEQTAVIHLNKTVDDEDAPQLKKLLLGFYNEGVQIILVDFSVTELIHKTCLMPIIICHRQLKERGGELKIINVTGKYVKHLFDMLELHRVVTIVDAGKKNNA